jgi:hypothetical protein
VLEFGAGEVVCQPVRAENNGRNGHAYSEDSQSRIEPDPRARRSAV